MSSLSVAEIVSRAWYEALDLDASSDVDGDFFEAGGNSLLAIALMEAVESQIDVTFPLDTLFMNGRLSAVIRACEAQCGTG